MTAEVHYLTKASFRSLIEHNPYIDKAHYLQDNRDELMRTLQQEDFDYIIDLHHNLRTLKVKKALGKKVFRSINSTSRNTYTSTSNCACFPTFISWTAILKRFMNLE